MMTNALWTHTIAIVWARSGNAVIRKAPIVASENVASPDRYWTKMESVSTSSVLRALNPIPEAAAMVHIHPFFMLDYC